MAQTHRTSEPPQPKHRNLSQDLEVIETLPATSKRLRNHQENDFNSSDPYTSVAMQSTQRIQSTCTEFRKTLQTQTKFLSKECRKMNKKFKKHSRSISSHMNPELAELKENLMSQSKLVHQSKKDQKPLAEVDSSDEPNYTAELEALEQEEENELIRQILPEKFHHRIQNLDMEKFLKQQSKKTELRELEKLVAKEEQQRRATLVMNGVRQKLYNRKYNKLADFGGGRGRKSFIAISGPSDFA